MTSRLLHTWAVPWRFLPFDSSKVLLEHGALYFDARSLYGRFYAPAKSRWLWPSVRDASGYQAMWTDFLGAAETGRPPELTLEHVPHPTVWAHVENATGYRHLCQLLTLGHTRRVKGKARVPAEGAPRNCYADIPLDALCERAEGLWLLVDAQHHAPPVLRSLRDAFGASPRMILTACRFGIITSRYFGVPASTSTRSPSPR